MVSNISPFRPNPREDGTSRSDRNKPQGAPRDDSFRKSINERRPSKEEEEHASAVEDREESRSLFDLSKSSKPKSKSTLGSRSSLKDSNSSEATPRSLTAKQNQDQGEESADQDQDSSQLTSSHEDFHTSSEMPLELPPPNEELYATAEEISTTGQEGLEEPPTMEQNITKPQNPQIEPPVKKPMEQALSQPMDALKQSQVTSNLQHQRVKGAKGEESSESKALGGASKKEKSSKSEKSDSKSEKTDVKGDATGAVNSSIQSAGFQTEKTSESQESAPSATIRELATQIVDRIQVMRKGDETQTTITLRHPPILEGATITLTTTDQAKREFNISFANLSPDAKILLDRKLREDSLTETLERKGIIVNTLTTSTQAEPSFTVDAGQAARDQQDQQQQQREQEQRRQKFQEPEDEEVT